MKMKYFILIIMIFNIFTLNYVSAESGNLQSAFTTDYIGKTAEGAGYSTDSTAQDPYKLIAIIIQTALSFVGIIFLILVIYGGYLWMMARGAEEQVTKSKNLISAAVIGLVIVLSAFLISNLVISEISQKTLTDGSSNSVTESP